ncbi:hypothetical protein NCAS_0B01630 [Naumovozyma castellii]|uniref:Diacylglycerol O-acyltransferase n=1 Tax=Naumovozyma castellii TaxID=27288 RepID=G0VBC1_NAUCA|nr:hypothetical protein NCAS_0B01630 [Naumovozyma castellii CBS 4309]CCC68247.1 hypothetical protein NCAS_0B01630 [Naumovozyma castellii CBS 4309]
MSERDPSTLSQQKSNNIRKRRSVVLDAIDAAAADAEDHIIQPSTSNSNARTNSQKRNKKPILDSCCSPTTPLKRRLQTASVAWHLSSFVLFSVFTLYVLSTPLFWPIVIPYMIYFFIDKAPANGGVVTRYSVWFRSLTIWKYYCDYFPITLVKTTDIQPTFTPRKQTTNGNIPPNGWKLRLWPTHYSINIMRRRNQQTELEPTGPRYIFGYHPHGIGALGAFGIFGTEGRNWSQLFPGIPVSLMTLVTQFHIPFYRDYLLAFGITAVSRKNSLKTLEKNQSICIVVGGARESLLSAVGSTELILNKRKGFVKLALKTGNVGLVPVFGFGETDCYNIMRTKEDSMLRRVQFWVKENCGFTIPIFYARGLFNYDFGLLPFRFPITVVIGKPILVKEKIANPSEEIVDYYHHLYVEELKKIYNENRDKYGYAHQELKIVG